MTVPARRGNPDPRSRYGGRFWALRYFIPVFRIMPGGIPVLFRIAEEKWD